MHELDRFLSLNVSHLPFYSTHIPWQCVTSTKAIRVTFEIWNSNRILYLIDPQLPFCPKTLLDSPQCCSCLLEPLLSQMATAGLHHHNNIHWCKHSKTNCRTVTGTSELLISRLLLILLYRIVLNQAMTVIVSTCGQRG